MTNASAEIIANAATTANAQKPTNAALNALVTLIKPKRKNQTFQSKQSGIKITLKYIAGIGNSVSAVLFPRKDIFLLPVNLFKEGQRMDKYPSHIDNIPRLNRIAGQIEGIKKMIEAGRYCPEIISQLRAVRSALKSVESNILQKHLQHCVAQSFASTEDKEQKIAELKTLFDRFND